MFHNKFPSAVKCESNEKKFTPGQECDDQMGPRGGEFDGL